MMFTALFVLLISFAVLRYFQDRKLIKSVTKLHRGTKSERALILRLLKSGIPAQAIFHDLYVKKPNGTFSQIDLAVATNVGILVFEVKDYSGWIFGNGYNRQWTQVLAYGRDNYYFYSPVKQNNSHISALRKSLSHCAKVPFISIIVFYGKCTLKKITFIPEDTFVIRSENVSKLVKGITSNLCPAHYADRHEVMRILAESHQNGNNPEIVNQHLDYVRQCIDDYEYFE